MCLIICIKEGASSSWDDTDVAGIHDVYDWDENVRGDEFLE